MDPYPTTLTGRTPTLPLSGIDHNAALDALTVAELRGVIAADVSAAVATLVRLDQRGETIDGALGELVRDCVSRVCPVRRGVA